jgi:UDP-N-acetylmuramoyl-L-alanyl-D-glutamate--2,6-diaminopimelate ligase
MMSAVDLTPRRSLDVLLAGIAAAPAVPLAGIASDSRAVGPGFAFFACRGASRHGVDFAGDAVAAGAAAVVWDSATAAEPPRVSVPAVPVPGLERWLGELANRWFDTPSARLPVSGVTGTNGKTTVAWLIASCLRRLGRACGYLGTLGAGLEPPFAEGSLTTPACIELHGTLAGFARDGATHAAIEVSSHALEQNRIDGLRLDSALFTNLSRDHIDYHGDMQAYGDVKARLFLEREVANRIVNVDSGFGQELALRCRAASGGRLVTVSTEPRHAFDPGPVAERLLVRPVGPSGFGFAIEVGGSFGEGACRLPLAGEFNVANAALVLAQLLCWGFPLGEALATLAACEPPPGRLQRVTVPDGRGPAVYVDYAHTPAGLEAVLKALRVHCTGNLWCVFGCGGDRDRGKRPLMGATAMRLADRAVVTTDNPRSENPDDIIAEVLAGMDGRAIAIADRERAIRWTIAEARDNDLVLIAGKGHENVQLVAGKRLPFSDYAVASDSLRSRAEGSAR